MDHYYILDAYNSVKESIDLKPTPSSTLLTEEQLEEYRNLASNIWTKMKQLRNNRVNMYLTLASIQILLVIFMIIMMIVSFDKTRMTDSFLTIILIFLIFGILSGIVYLLLFLRRINDSNNNISKLKNIFQLDLKAGKNNSLTLENLYEKANAVNNYKPDEDDNLTEEEQSKDEDNIAYLKKVSQVNLSLDENRTSDEYVKDCGRSGSDISCVTPGLMYDSFKHGVLYTVNPEQAGSIDVFINKLRSLIGATTYKEIEEEDIETIINEIVIPKMISVTDTVYRTSDLQPASTKNNDQCSEECQTRAEKLADDVLNENIESPPALILEAAWEDCFEEMKEQCLGKLTKKGTAAQKCEFGCSRIDEEPLQIVKRTVKGWIPVMTSESGWSESEEETCTGEILKDDTIDSVYYGRTDSDSAKKCYIHDSSAKRAEWEKKAGIEDGLFMYRENDTMHIPGADPAVIADEIFNEIQLSYTTFDISDYDTLIYEELRAKDGNFDKNEDWYKNVFMILSNRLLSTKPSLDLVIPDIERFRNEMSKITGYDFIQDVTWPSVKASMYTHVIEKRRMQPLSSITDDVHIILTIICSMAALFSVLGYYVFSRNHMASRIGVVTFSKFTERWKRHIIVLCILLLLWTIVFTQLSQRKSRVLFNQRIKKSNTDKFNEELVVLRDWLLNLTDSVPHIRGEKADIKDLLYAVNNDEIQIINTFQNSNDVMVDILSDKQITDFVNKSQNVISLYDKCNNIVTGSPIPFPVSDVIIYVIGILITIFSGIYISRRFDIKKMVERVQRVKTLRDDVYMGGGEAVVTELNSILSCDSQSVNNKTKLMSHLFAYVMVVFSVIMTVNIVQSTNDYRDSLNGGFMTMRSRCVR
ncbi:hypothetical protein TetV_202 [Tetraselmis virus 1]|uniref:Uncharacterized protein n=1 Tax=Tetraselmis virus 1 TaxID=2060617 RepID=A0A2P0VN08_9VIRU|nr:hypothetical protein QJ968_gp202 [Tetraselmis virus 1]AUF82294.1 hypothetical protein TetV_202 [Tetraselmis virus 1]